MGRYVLTVPAKQDLKEINRYIALFNPEAARRLKTRIQQQCKRLADYPNMGINATWIKVCRLQGNIPIILHL